MNTITNSGKTPNQMDGDQIRKAVKDYVLAIVDSVCDDGVQIRLTTATHSGVEWTFEKVD